ncbi:MAG: FIST N-terminal domain-containing protein [Acidimicrobiales bacterium]
MPFAAALSSHPVTAHATGEVVGQVIDTIGAHPDLAVMVASRSHMGALEDAAAAVRTLLGPTVLLGWVAAEVNTDAGWGPPSSTRDAVGLWAAHTGPVVPVRVADLASPEWTQVSPASFDRRSMVVLGAAGAGLGAARPPGLTVAGAVSDVAGAPVVLDGIAYATGAVGVVLGPSVDLTVLVEQGRRPVGAPSTVTRAEGTLLVDLDDRPAMSVLRDMARDQVPARDIVLINRSVHLEVRAPPGVGSVHTVRGRDAETGSLITDPAVQPGDVVQFCVRDPEEAEVRARRVVDGSEGGVLVWRTRRSDTFSGPDVGFSGADVGDAGGEWAEGGTRSPRSLLACQSASLLGMSEGDVVATDPDTIGIGLFREPRVALE